MSEIVAYTKSTESEELRRRAGMSLLGDLIITKVAADPTASNLRETLAQAIKTTGGGLNLELRFRTNNSTDTSGLGLLITDIGKVKKDPDDEKEKIPCKLSNVQGSVITPAGKLIIIFQRDNPKMKVGSAANDDDRYAMNVVFPEHDDVTGITYLVTAADDVKLISNLSNLHAKYLAAFKFLTRCK